MDLIYTDENRKDINVLVDYNLDLAFGRDENDFELEMNIEEGCLKPNYFIYIEGTQYGGIIDDLNPDNATKTIKYIGRTWHGILDSKIVSPPEGEDYLILNGEANNVVRYLIDLSGLSSLFNASEEDSGIVIENYSFPRYAHLYQGIRRMLYEFGGKLNLSFSDKKVNLSVSPYVDYTKDEEWDTSDFAIAIKKCFNPVNHLYCLGSGDLKNRKVIELFTDENGGIQPYATVDEPYKDEQYILDRRNQLFVGLLDRSEVFDCSSAQTAENYEKLTDKPIMWVRVYPNYYKYDEENNSYSQLTREYQDNYLLLEEKPADWNFNYEAYYLKGEDGNYKQVSDDLAIESTFYEALKTQPKGWKKNYKEYYYLWSDGVSEEYRAVSADRYTVYKKQTRKPSDWSSNRGSYYIKINFWKHTYTIKKKTKDVWKTEEKSYEYKIKEVDEKNRKVKLKKSTLVKRDFIRISEYVNNSHNKAKMSDFSHWANSKYGPFYTQISKDKAPDFISGKYFFKNVVLTSPTFLHNTYYSKVEGEVIPVFRERDYFRKVVDNYADIVANGIAKLQEYWNLDSLTVTLSADDTEYDIGDVVGATENTTGASVTSQITKKIVKIENDNASIQYELGNDDATISY